MAYIQCNHCGKETEDINVFGIKIENCIWCDKLLRKKSKKSQTDENFIEKIEQDLKKGIEGGCSGFLKLFIP